MTNMPRIFCTLCLGVTCDSGYSTAMDENDNIDEEIAALLEKLAELRVEHRHLDQEITALLDTGAIDMINIARMKKQKLRLKDKIALIEDKVTPDIIA